MKPNGDHTDPLLSICPLVRYVDESQAVIDIRVAIYPQESSPNQPTHTPLEVQIQITGTDGFIYEHQTQLSIQDHTETIRFEMGDPKRWWPSGMGDQTLYDLNVTIFINDNRIDQWENTIGLTSVRPANNRASQAPASSQSATDSKTILLVNGQQCPIQSVVPVGPADERHILPAGNHSLLVIHDHYGPDLLYNAADRAGTLLVQSIPFTHQENIEWSVRCQVDRLASHPSLVGWLVGKTDETGDQIADHLHELDPTRNVFRSLPGA